MPVNAYTDKKLRAVMSRLIIDGSSVFEIDEECVKRKKVPPECDIEKYLTQDERKNTLQDSYREKNRSGK